MQKPKHSPPNLKNLLAQLPYLPRTLSLVWSAAPGWTSAWAALLLVQGLLPVATVYLTRAVVDSLVAAIRSPGSWQELLPTLLLVGAAALVLLLGSILGSLSQWVRTAQSETVSDSIKGLIHAQAVDLDLAYYETPAYYDQLYRASVDAVDRPVALLGNIGGLIQGGITLLAMAGVLMAYSAWLPLILLISTLPALFVVVRYTLRFQRWRMKNTINERRTRYFDWMLSLVQGEHPVDQRAAHALLRLDAHPAPGCRRGAPLWAGRSLPSILPGAAQEIAQRAHPPAARPDPGRNRSLS